ncbi:hypothetical protein ACFO1B_47035 [Dactylosporangium siamense]|uniref:Uncharacterized protein n=1 Tax=Dactylosporangium siamense TaxID=685454 RepID=A0A919PXU5_9ACTN|nr:hypothetical protein [Dactylosporangium siamense]GIG50508.1 hypothetical protein Dsi01nite_085490 [Dactylosporangium siamense]
MPAKADSSRTPKNHNATPNNQPNPSIDRKIKTAASGGFGTLLASSLTQALGLVPPGLETEFHGGIALVAVTGLLYLALPRKAKITLEWER